LIGLASDASLPQIKEGIRIYTHPEYDIKTKQNSIALIEVQENIRYRTLTFMEPAIVMFLFPDLMILYHQLVCGTTQLMCHFS
jgi:hypothetical protein